MFVVLMSDVFHMFDSPQSRLNLSMNEHNIKKYRKKKKKLQAQGKKINNRNGKKKKHKSIPHSQLSAFF